MSTTPRRLYAGGRLAPGCRIVSPPKKFGAGLDRQCLPSPPLGPPLADYHNYPYLIAGPPCTDHELGISLISVLCSCKHSYSLYSLLLTFGIRIHSTLPSMSTDNAAAHAEVAFAASIPLPDSPTSDNSDRPPATPARTRSPSPSMRDLFKVMSALVLQLGALAGATLAVRAVTPRACRAAAPSPTGHLPSPRPPSQSSNQNTRRCILCIRVAGHNINLAHSRLWRQLPCHPR